MILDTFSQNFESSLAAAVNKLNNAEPVVMPTETVYGLAARIDQPEAIKKIFTYKKRPFFDPLIVHIYEISQIKLLSDFSSPVIDTLIKKFWPGPLTLILPKKDSVNSMITSGLDSVGIRIPNHPIALELLKRVNCPLAAPSANLFGHTSPTKAIHVESDFNRDDLLILDGGSCQVGIESTVLKVSQIDANSSLELSILRKGIITKSDIDTALALYNNNYYFSETINKASAPGHMKHHYMPNTPLILLSQNIDHKNLFSMIELDFKNIPEQIDGINIIKPQLPIRTCFELTFNSDPEIACRELYDKLKQGSEQKKDIMIFKIKDFMIGENWEGFLERITKASSLHY